MKMYIYQLDEELDTMGTVIEKARNENDAK